MHQHALAACTTTSSARQDVSVSMIGCATRCQPSCQEATLRLFQRRSDLNGVSWLQYEYVDFAGSVTFGAAAVTVPAGRQASVTATITAPGPSLAFPTGFNCGHLCLQSADCCLSHRLRNLSY